MLHQIKMCSFSVAGYKGGTKKQIGHSFMNFLAGGEATLLFPLIDANTGASGVAENFFAPIEVTKLVKESNSGKGPMMMAARPKAAIEFTELTDVEGALGETVSVTVEAKGEGLKYQWYFQDANATTFSKSSTKVATYEVEMTKARAGRSIYCVITDKNGNTVTTNTVKLIRVAAEELEIVTQPTDAKVALGDDIAVKVEAKGEGLKYRWYFKDANATKFSTSSITTDTYTAEMTTARANREVYCVITDALGNTVTSDTVKLIRVAKEELKILDQPKEEDIYAEMGATLKVTVKAQGENVKYQWYFCDANATKFSASSTKVDTYEVEMNKTRANREIYCVITDALGNKIESNHFFLRPGSAPAAEPTQPSEPATEPTQPSEPTPEPVAEPVAEPEEV